MSSSSFPLPTPAASTTANYILAGPVSGGPATAAFRLAQLADIQAWLGTQSANTIFSGPTTGAAASPTFRTAVAEDIATGTPTSGYVPTAAGAGVKPAWSVPYGVGGWVRIAQVITAASQTTVDFSSIAATFTSLMVEYIAQYNNGGTSYSFLMCKVNNDGTAGNYTSANRIGVSSTTVYSNSTPSAGSNGAGCGFISQTGTTGCATAGRVWFPYYAQTTFHKYLVGEAFSNTTTETGTTLQQVTRWKSTSAINQLTFSEQASTAFINGSIFTLYGKA